MQKPDRIQTSRQLISRKRIPKLKMITGLN